MNIEVYSVKSFTGSALKSKLEVALAEKSLPYHVSMINHIDAFAKAGITTVPAIRVGNKIIEHRDDITLDDMVKMVINLLTAGCDHYILVPVDFTSESIHALRYARMMATRLNMGITVAHIHQPLFDPITGTAFDVEMMKRNKEHLDEMLIEVGWDQYQSGSHIPVNTHFDIGDVTSHVVHLAEDAAYKFIIMSTKAEDSFTKRILGSVSTHVGRLGSKPVIVVPPDAPLLFPERIVVGLTDELFHENAMNYLLQFASEQQVFVDFVYVSNEEEPFNTLKHNLTEKILGYKKKLSGFDIRTVPYVADHIIEALTDFAMHNQAGLLVLVTRHRNLIESLGHRSTSKKALLHPVLPVMILHGHDEKGAGMTNYLYDMIKEG